jgi:hypothetical protein
MPPERRARPGALSCLACRSKHLKCNGEQPVCHRCAKSATTCVFVPSRRGINLIENSRRNKEAIALSPSVSSTIELDFPVAETSGFDLIESSRRRQDLINSNVAAESHTTSSAVTDHLILLYYQQIHPPHPFILPQKLYLKSPEILPSHLQAAMRLMASHLTGDSVRYEEAAREAIQRETIEDGFKVQSLVLLALASFARSEKDQGIEAIQQAADLAVRIGDNPMALGDPSCALRLESWRRTCAELQSVSALARLFISCPTKFVFPDGLNVPSQCITYNECHVTTQKTFGEMQNRTFMDEELDWPSFGYEIEAAGILSAVLKTSLHETLPSTVDSIDASINNFLLSVPEDGRMVNGDEMGIDEKMFSALMVIHLATISLHLPRSELVHIRSIATVCRTSQVDVAMLKPKAHRVAALKAANAISRLLIARGTNLMLSPCFACGITLCFAVQLPAYLQEQNATTRALLKEYLRLSLNVLRVMSKVWPIAKLVRSQIAQVAREVLIASSRNDLRPVVSMPTLMNSEAELPGDDQWLQDIMTSSMDCFTENFAFETETF